MSNARLSYIAPRLSALDKALAGKTITKSVVDNFTSEDPLALEGYSFLKKFQKKTGLIKKLKTLLQLTLKEFQRY